jgi:hypothetical protein
LRGGFFIFSSIGEAVKKLWHTEKEFNCTPHCYSLPQGERREESKKFSSRASSPSEKFSSKTSSPLTGED